MSRGAKLKDFESSQNFHLLKVQAKFLQGFTSYNQKEQQVLREWLSNIEDRQKAETFFLEKVLRQRPSQQVKYKNSILEKILTEKP